MLRSGQGEMLVAFSDDAMEVSVADTGKDDKQVVVYLPNCKEDQVISEGLLYFSLLAHSLSLTPSLPHSLSLPLSLSPILSHTWPSSTVSLS